MRKRDSAESLFYHFMVGRGDVAAVMDGINSKNSFTECGPFSIIVELKKCLGILGVWQRINYKKQKLKKRSQEEKRTYYVFPRR